ncbi:pre-mRNA-processing factor 17 [Cloeon dipterum]|uniref:pre-mRNA-processing factor 17 n=1 Tax=Cloeon dipterum TaxID=197152 RepID=UPI003220069A
MNALQEYASSDEEGESSKTEVKSTPKSNEEALAHLKPIDPEGVKFSQKNSLQICAAPDVIPQGTQGDTIRHIDVTTKEVAYNPKFEELFAPQVGPDNPFKSDLQKANKNILSGFVEAAHMSDFQFEAQRRTFHTYGYALDPTVSGDPGDGRSFVGASDLAEEKSGLTTFEPASKRPGDKRKRVRNDQPEDIEGFIGPWGGFVDEVKVAKPSEDEQAELEEYLAKKQKKGKPQEDKTFEEKAVMHISDPLDYQGRSFLHPPHDVGVNLRSDAPPSRCFLPKTHIHTWTGHTKGISAIRWFPKTAHLLLSSSMDGRVKLWEVYNERRCIQTYYGHRQAVRDICFNASGTEFLSAGYDRYIKLWDTETGRVKRRFSSRKIPYCIKFHPLREKQHLFVAGTSDKKIICWDTRSGDVVQEYDRHLGAVNTITFVDDNRRFVTTSDDKSLRVWEWDIPVDMKYIADPSMHSMPAVSMAPNQKWLACQSMDNKIVIFSALNRFKMNRKKTFTGHMVAGYACSLDFSPDMSYLISGDADGKCYVWDWKTTKLYKKWKAHDNVCIACLWHPHEPSKVVTAGWDGVIKYWD